MHIVVIGWLFVIGTMALTLSSPLAAIAFFVCAGVAPVALAVWLAARRAGGDATARAARERRR